MVPDIILVPPCCFPMGGLLSVAKIQQSPQTRCGGHRCQVKERLGGERWPCQGCVSICAVISYEPTGTLGRLFVNKTTTTCQNGFIFSFFPPLSFCQWRSQRYPVIQLSALLLRQSHSNQLTTLVSWGWVADFNGLGMVLGPEGCIWAISCCDHK